MGGHTNTWRDDLEDANSITLERKNFIAGSTRRGKEDDAAVLVRRFVMEATMQASDLGRTVDRAADSTKRRPPLGMNWASAKVGRCGAERWSRRR